MSDKVASTLRTTLPGGLWRTAGLLTLPADSRLTRHGMLGMI